MVQMCIFRAKTDRTTDVCQKIIVCMQSIFAEGDVCAWKIGDVVNLCCVGGEVMY